ncbi:MAG: hypothetical protein U9N42_06510 [Campylobacterota bacterium]|nr:hypothetical protein [Campylobacterota bacterium]
MIKFLKNIIHVVVLLLVTIVTIVTFAPKDQLFFLAEQELQKQDISLKYRHISSGLFSVHVEDIEVFYMGSKVSTSKSLDITFIDVVVQNTTFNGLAKKALTSKADIFELKASTNFLNATGTFGTFSGAFNIDSLSASVTLKPSKAFMSQGSMLTKSMKKSGGNYVFTLKI